ncbi:MAG: hypothetical protein EXX96DRAFT_483214, partial [Benjaminiella poitrasii]
SAYQDKYSYVKLMKEMKANTDEPIDLGISDPTSLGVLTEGSICTLYMMTMKGEGVYIPNMLKKFFFVEFVENAMNILSVVECFFFFFVKVCHQ